MSECTPPSPPPPGRRHLNRMHARPPSLSSAAVAFSAISARVPLFLPSSTKTVGEGGGLRRNLTLFDFEGEQITQIDCGSLKRLMPPRLACSIFKATTYVPMQFNQSDRRIRHVLTAHPSQLEEDIEEGPITSSGRERGGPLFRCRPANVFPLLFPFSQGLTEITQPRTSLIREPCICPI